jgi:hypothetical protein
MKNKQIRIARPTDNLDQIKQMYLEGLEFKEIFSFENHEDFNGVIMGHPDHIYHLEFTSQKNHKVGKCPTKDHLLVFYIEDKNEWQQQCLKMEKAGFKAVPSYNPYWDKNGTTFEDVDGYRIVIQNQKWG